ncbi:MAG: hypothetical protein PHQ67_03970 [Fermentimonas sp.]|nr:hypothetical protein [Fermentimonas sp.]
MRTIIDLGKSVTAFINGKNVDVENLKIVSDEYFKYSPWEQTLFNAEFVIKGVTDLVFDY